MQGQRRGRAACQQAFHLRQAGPERGELATDFHRVVLVTRLLRQAQAPAEEQRLLPGPRAERLHAPAQGRLRQHQWRRRDVGQADIGAALLRHAQQRQAHGVGLAVVADQPQRRSPDGDRLGVLAAGQVRQRRADPRLQTALQRQQLTRPPQRTDRQVDVQQRPFGGRQRCLQVELQRRVDTSLHAHRQAVGQDRFEVQDPHLAGAQRRGVQFQGGHAPEPRVAGLSGARRQRLGTQSLQLEMLGKQLHPFVPAHRVRQNTHTTPLRRPTLSCTTVARLPLR
ncbi:hypothetical protein PAERUG_P45_London_17_VIM_2_12_12_04040 [Pseudomonas aeruginosa]|nr:hypothetical protein PAERUG_P45_London_17_VIM_2_12_12_04040 [Pseudomonas aeruginosa]CRX27444.1 hypothetical protein PAERUG_P54_1_London_24_VIM_2_04_13_04637 [Pseudomonas aeruginosa]CRX31573.1 hypothetical protein PAERUG_E1_London_17_VIM_2_02_09_01248 [Pseudomonas aeruginosa]